MVKKLVIFLFLIVPIYSYADIAYYKTPEWLHLLYYEKLGSGYKSLADSPSFFMSPSGKTNPHSEYTLSLQLTKAQDPFFRKNFPLRYKRIAIYHKIPYRPLIKPEKDIQSIMLVYPNRYMSNPASMFGHLFLLLKSKKGLMNSDVFHYIADTAGTNEYAYIINGLSGAYKGGFLREPYYRKIKQYNYIEDREIIYYDLKLSPQQVQDMVLHTKELRHTHFDYYFLDENCALFIAKALNVILEDPIKTKKSVVFPTQITNALYQKGTLLSTYKRPSSTKMFSKIYAKLSPDEKAELITLLLYKSSTPSSSLEVLYSFIYISEYFINNHSQLASTIRYNRILVYKQLQKLDASNVRPTLIETTPITPIKSSQIAFTYDSETLTSLSYHPIFYDNPFEEIEVKQINVLSPRISLRPDKQIQVDLTLVEISNINTYTSVLNHYAWSLKSYLGYHNSLHTDQSYEIGIAYPIFNESLALLFLGFNFSNYDLLSEQRLKNLSLYPALTVGLMSQTLHDTLKTTLAYEYRYNTHYLTPEITTMAWGLHFQMKYMYTADANRLLLSIKKLF